MKTINDRTLLSAYVVLDAHGEIVAKIHFLRTKARQYTNSTVQCDVYDLRIAGKLREYRLVHQHRAGGGGYNKYAAAIAGAVIQGNTMGEGWRNSLASAQLRERLIVGPEAM